MLSSFLLAFHSFRIDNVLQTIRFLERNHPEVVSDSELILLCQDRIGTITSQFAATHTVCLNFPNMQKSRAINHGAGMVKSDKVVILDSDRILPPGYFLSVLTSLQRKTVTTARITHRLTCMETDEAIASNWASFDVEPRKTSNIFSGNASLYIDDYWAAGGMNEQYIGYGWEDDDMSMRLRHIGTRFIFREEPEIHLYHPRDSYGTGDQKVMYLNNGLRFHNDWKLPIETHLQEEINNHTRNLI